MIGAAGLLTWLAPGLSLGSDEDRALVGAIRRPTVRVGLGAAILLLLDHAARLYLQARTFVDPGEAITGPLLDGLIRDSAWGHGWLWQVGAAAGCVAGWWVALGTRSGIGLAAAATLGAALAAPLTGHAVTDAAGPLGWALDAAHGLAGGLWLGTLSVMVFVAFGVLRGDPARRGALVKALVDRFSPVALVAAGVTVVLGSIMAWRYLAHDLTQLVFGSYGRALALKLIAVAGVAALGGFNWRVVRPKLGTVEGADRVARTGRWELVFGMLLLAITAVLVALPMPAESHGS